MILLNNSIIVTSPPKIEASLGFSWPRLQRRRHVTADRRAGRHPRRYRRPHPARRHRLDPGRWGALARRHRRHDDVPLHHPRRLRWRRGHHLARTGHRRAVRHGRRRRL